MRSYGLRPGRALIAAAIAASLACGVHFQGGQRLAFPSAEAVTLGPPVAHYDAWIPKVSPVGDSIVEGDNSTTASWRNGLYHSALAAGTPFLFVGGLSFAGVDNSMAVNPQHEGHSGYAVGTTGPANSLISAVFLGGGGGIRAYAADIVILAGGTNDIGVNGNDAATLLAFLSTQLDLAWSTRTYAHTQIVQCTILKRLDPTTDAVVQAVNAGLPALIAGKSFAANVTLVNLYDAIQDPTVGGGYADPVHPNATGDTDMAVRMWASFPAVIAKARGATWRVTPFSAPGTRRERLAMLDERRGRRIVAGARVAIRRARPS